MSGLGIRLGPRTPRTRERSGPHPRRRGSRPTGTPSPERRRRRRIRLPASTRSRAQTRTGRSNSGLRAPPRSGAKLIARLQAFANQLIGDAPLPEPGDTATGAKPIPSVAPTTLTGLNATWPTTWPSSSATTRPKDARWCATRPRGPLHSASGTTQRNGVDRSLVVRCFGSDHHDVRSSLLGLSSIIL